MGSIKNQDIKKTSSLLLKRYPDKFSTDFTENKNILREMDIVDGKNVLNQLAGSVTRMRKVSIKRGY